jgi:hypothetical protein
MLMGDEEMKILSIFLGLCALLCEFSRFFLIFMRIRSNFSVAVLIAATDSWMILKTIVS